MWRMLRRIASIGAFLLGVALLATVATSDRQASAGPSAVWCYNGEHWLGYAEGIPGSAKRETFAACLSRSVERDEVIALRGRLLDGGALIDVGDGSIYWEYGPRESSLYITAFDDRVVLFAGCGDGFELNQGVSTAIATGGFCNGPATVRRSDERVVDPNFTVYVVGRQFIADGEDGWYHVVADQTGVSNNPIPRGEFVLRNRGAAVWLRTEDDHATTGQTYYVRRPLAGYRSQIQFHNVSDWGYRLGALIPLSFRWAARDFLPDGTAYWTVMKDFVDAVMDDLFRGRVDPPTLDLVAHWSGLIHADRVVNLCQFEEGPNLVRPVPHTPTPIDRVPECIEDSEQTIDTRRSGYFAKKENVSDLLDSLAQRIVGTDSTFGGTLTATRLMLWERYVPGFNREAALELAGRYGVDVGVSINVNPVSDRTMFARDILSRIPPALPSDHEPIDADQLQASLVLNLGQTYSTADLANVTIATSDYMPTCSFFQGTFTINPGGTWNGLKLSTFTGPSETGLFVGGTPTMVGRVRVRLELTNACPEAPSHRPHFVGYSEVIVVDPEAGE
jgi:hypothetical protein